MKKKLKLLRALETELLALLEQITSSHQQFRNVTLQAIWDIQRQIITNDKEVKQRPRKK